MFHYKFILKLKKSCTDGRPNCYAPYVTPSEKLSIPTLGSVVLTVVFTHLRGLGPPLLNVPIFTDGYRMRDSVLLA